MVIELHLRGQHLPAPTEAQVEWIHYHKIRFKHLFKLFFFNFTARVNSYRLAYSTSPNDIIDENGFVHAYSVIVNETDVTSGSLNPLASGSSQISTINLHRTHEVDPLPVYFTIGSVLSNGLRANLNRKIISNISN